MKAVILAAGYATRLYPLTRDFPKPLLKVGGRAIVDHVLDRLATIPELDAAYVVTNAKFARHFEEHAAGYDGRLELRVLDDGSTSEDDRLGAIGDLAFVLEAMAVDDDVVVVAGDNVFDASLEPLARLAAERDAPVLTVYDVGDTDALRAFNTVETDAAGRITFFEEKPEHPRGTVAGIAVYVYPRSALGLVRQYVADGNNPDQPGRLVQWLFPRTDVYVWQLEGRWFDIGSLEGLADADRAFGGTGTIP